MHTNEFQDKAILERVLVELQRAEQLLADREWLIVNELDELRVAPPQAMTQDELRTEIASRMGQIDGLVLAQVLLSIRRLQLGGS